MRIQIWIQGLNFFKILPGTSSVLFDKKKIEKELWIRIKMRIRIQIQGLKKICIRIRNPG